MLSVGEPFADCVRERMTLIGAKTSACVDALGVYFGEVTSRDNSFACLLA